MYQIVTYERFSDVFEFLLPQDRTVKLHNHSDEKVPLPSPVLLYTHATTGKGEMIDQIMEDRDQTGCLAADGSSGVLSLVSLSLHVSLESINLQYSQRSEC